MMRLSTLLRNPADWMTGKETDSAIVLTSRIRLARNLANHPFPGWARKTQRIEAMGELRKAVELLPEMKDGFSHELSELSSVHKQVLVERHLISREQAARGEGSAAVVNRKQSLSIMINEEDHLRMQAITGGLHLKKAYKALDKVDRELEKQLGFAYDKRLGFLTACPTNLGTGMRASAMLHLPGLVIGDHIKAVVHAVNKLGLAVRGIFGEGTESLGHMFQISNQSTLGESEEQIIERLERVITEVRDQERFAREKLLEDQTNGLADKIGRALGMLKYAHLIDSKEALTYISMLRLGGDLGFFSPEMLSICDQLLMDIEPAHLQHHAGKKLSAEERDVIRAEIIRDRLQNIASPDSSPITEINPKKDPQDPAE
ncbi:protein arginine kinase [Persicirhabdus sediminis]|uniref:Protein-arginine kinase n=1 Tax=Persicirhabdus sediminis TaxID=454144 RepID=A0A8J7SJS2_9BACT|nr:protein arginine kinase [Persicirhabdus sediminis]MBK1792345.1 protein arginine kinase [Persicirhabdus sediminis]